MNETEEQTKADLPDVKSHETEADQAAAVQPDGKLASSEPSPTSKAENGHVEASSLPQEESEELVSAERQETLDSAPVVEDDAGSEDSDAPEEEAEGGEALAADVGSPAKTLEYADKLMEEGLDAMKSKDYALAIDRFSRALEIRVEHFGELSPQCSHTYYKYGCALLYKAQDENEALALGDAVTKKTYNIVECGRLADGEGSSHKSEKKDVKSTNKLGKCVEEDQSGVEKEDVNGGDDGEDVEIGEEEESDLDLAFNMLDIARVIVEKNVTEDTMEKVDIISALGDVSLEREDIRTCLEDYRKALSMLGHLVEPDSRLLAEIHFKLCMALQMDNKIKDAVPHCKTAISVCEARSKRLKVEVNNSSDDSTLEKEEEIKTLDQLLIDLNAKLEDLQEMPSMPTLAEIMENFKTDAQGKNNGASSTAMTETCTRSSGTDVPMASASGSSSQVMHLGVVGRGVKRAVPVPITPECPSKKPTVLSPESADSVVDETLKPGSETSESK